MIIMAHFGQYLMEFYNFHNFFCRSPRYFNIIHVPHTIHKTPAFRQQTNHDCWLFFCSAAFNNLISWTQTFLQYSFGTSFHDIMFSSHLLRSVAKHVPTHSCKTRLSSSMSSCGMIRAWAPGSRIEWWGKNLWTPLHNRREKIFTAIVWFLKLCLDPVGNMKAGSLLDESWKTAHYCGMKYIQ